MIKPISVATSFVEGVGMFTTVVYSNGEIWTHGEHSTPMSLDQPRKGQWWEKLPENPHIEQPPLAPLGEIPAGAIPKLLSQDCIKPTVIQRSKKGIGKGVQTHTECYCNWLGRIFNCCKHL